jgi:hypothetical protein
MTSNPTVLDAFVQDLQPVKDRIVLAKDYCGRTAPGGGECKNGGGGKGGGLPSASGAERIQAVVSMMSGVLFACFTGAIF